MAEIVLVKQQPALIAECDREAARRVLFGMVDGLGEKGRKAWRRFVNGLMRLEPGEMVEIRTHRERVGSFHRKHMAFEQRVFEAQERFDSFEQFRNWLKVGAGHCDWIPGPRGAVIPVPKSISYAKLEQEDMEHVHDEIVKFLRTVRAAAVLWPHAKGEQRAIDDLLEEFEWA
jgi:hypothetical protein